MASIKVKYRASKISGNEGTIYYQIIHNRKVRQSATTYKIRSEEWDNAKSALIIDSGSQRKKYLEEIRESVRRDLDCVAKIIRRYDDRSINYSADEVVEEFKRINQEYSLFNYMTNVISQLSSNGYTRTSEAYTSALSSFKKFRKDEDLPLYMLTPDVMQAFESWHKGRGNTNNTISFYTRILRAVYNRAIEEGTIEDRHPFRRVYTGIDKTVKRALTIEQIKKMKRLDLSFDASLDYARDMFLLSFLLRGMSFVDMAFLKKSDLSEGYLSYRRKKTGQRLKISWVKEMQAIVDKYPANSTQYLLPILAKEESDERYAYRRVAYNINRNLRKIAILAGLSLDFNLVLYCARHSWASIAKAQGIPIGVISEGMGHDSEATTQIYLASIATSEVDKANFLIISALSKKRCRGKSGDRG